MISLILKVATVAKDKTGSTTQEMYFHLSMKRLDIDTEHKYEKPAKVLMKESLCEALFLLESGSKLWKAIWLATKSDALQYLEIQFVN